MKERVVVERLAETGLDRYAEGFVLIWYYPEEGNFGGMLDGEHTEEQLADLTGDEWESVALDVEARFVAAATGATKIRDGLVWPTRRAAAAALSAIKDRVKARREARPYPEWATQALAAGWKAPKGWTP
jgi:hypothetical protein